MFINKWLIADSVDGNKCKELQAGLCLYLAKEPADISDVYEFLQSQPVENSFAILLCGDDFDLQEAGDSYIEKIIGLFFQPSYYLVNHQPLIFLSSPRPVCADFLGRLVKKSINQGLKNILILETKIFDYTNDTTNQFAYRVTDSHIDFSLLLKNWLVQYLKNKNPTEIHLLVSSKDQEAIKIFSGIPERENALKGTEVYEIAGVFYQKQKLIEEYKHELSLKNIQEKDIQLYLSMQKEQGANNLRWYYSEYEILPLWYKRLGHIIKVLMGKRTFRSLFNDRVKKYKD